MTYRPGWDVNRARGEEAEGLFRKLRSDILSGQAEVKCDDRARETENVYIEYLCKRRDGWHPSGIAITTAETWVIYIEPVLISMPVATLKALGRRHWRNGDRKECVIGSHPTKGVVIPLSELLRGVVETYHGTEHGAPTDEPPAPAPYDNDMPATDDGWMDTLGDPLPDHQHAAKNLCPKCGEPGAFYAVVDRKYCWPCFNKQASRANA